MSQPASLAEMSSPQTTLRRRLDTMAGRCASALAAQQVRMPEGFPSLGEIGSLPATIGGRRLEPARLTRHPQEPRLIKIGLSDDLVPDPEVLAETRTRLKGQRARNGVFDKMRRYLLTPDRHTLARLAGFLGSKLRARRAPPFGAAAAAKDKAWALVPGVNFWQDDDGRWRCSDHGAIYERRLTSRALRYPSQVGADLYTNSCAAALFRRMADKGGDPVWAEALTASADYFAGLGRHPRQRLESDHREFDYGPLRIAFGDGVAAAAAAGWTNYDPVNVYGLRYYNAALAGDAARRSLCLDVLEANQRPDGLLADNFAGNAVDSADLTYHQYALAMLCLGNALVADRRADGIIQKALACSVANLLSNGEATYYGRGANNVYHLASCACAFSYGIARLGLDLGGALALVAARLEAFQDGEGLWPTAMNRAERDAMIGWHGSESQYSALSGFLLSEAASLLATTEGGPEPARPLPAPTPPRILDRLVLRGHGIDLALTRGGGLVPWSQGLHGSGLAGMAALVVGGINCLLACDRLTPWGAQPLLVGDVQDQDLAGRHRLAADGAEAALLTRGGKGPRRRIRYALVAEGIAVSVEDGAGPAGHALALVGACRLEGGTGRALTIVSDAGFAVEVVADAALDAALVPVPVNPQGPGTLVRLAAAGNAITVRYRFIPAPRA